MKRISFFLCLLFFSTMNAHSTELSSQSAAGIANSALLPGYSGVSATLNNSQSDEFEESWFTTAKTHQYLGLASVGLATLALMSPKPAEGKDDYSSEPHYQFAVAASYFGGAAVATGLAFHYKDLRLTKLKDPDTLHTLLGLIGAAGFLMAVDSAPDEGHAGYGTLGFASMLTAIKITW
ncbi:MAG: hypothetical protein OEZ47_14075 [Gammaproteobacteria bacterium]|nr:hypothetical protein [Gammaproteobacteria bacterium]